jgi:hypothetical protein
VQEIFLELCRLLFAAVAGLLFVLCVLGNWGLVVGGLYQAVIKKRQTSVSLVLPFLGPIFGIVFFLLVPIEGMWRFWWMAPLIEPTWLLAVWCSVTAPFVKRDQTDA